MKIGLKFRLNSVFLPCVFLLFCVPSFSVAEETGVLNPESDAQIQVPSEIPLKKDAENPLAEDSLLEQGAGAGFSAGLRISFFGFETPFSLSYKHFEAEGFFGIPATFLKGSFADEFWTGIALGYVFNTVSRGVIGSGYISSLGVEYVFMRNSPFGFLFTDSDFTDREIFLHSALIYYRGEWRMNDFIGFFYRFRLPVASVAFDEDGNMGVLHIADGGNGTGYSLLAPIVTFAIGVRILL